ncbi:MAG TPA: hypothetical protein VNR61_14130 [Niallia sp.]|nr:hypothetical protein [Niallia sp.]
MFVWKYKYVFIYKWIETDNTVLYYNEKFLQEGMIKLNKMNETIGPDSNNLEEQNDTYSTEEIKSLERITGNKLVHNLNFSSMPLFIRIMGYVIIAFLILVACFVFFLILKQVS